MAAESLYVGMTRGRPANLVMVITDAEAEYGPTRRRGTLEMLGHVLARPAAEASAHRVMRARLACNFDEPGVHGRRPGARRPCRCRQGRNASADPAAWSGTQPLNAGSYI